MSRKELVARIAKAIAERDGGEGTSPTLQHKIYAAAALAEFEIILSEFFKPEEEPLDLNP